MWGDIMPIDVFWVNEEKTILQYDITGRWAWDDLYPQYYKALEMERSVDHFVDIIIDLRESRSIPPSVFTHIKNIADRQPDNVGLTVIVSDNRFVKVLMNAGTRAYKKIAEYFQVADTIDEALQLIEQIAAAREHSHQVQDTDKPGVSLSDEPHQ